MDAIADNPTKEADDTADSVLKTQDENVPINDNTNFHSNTNVSHTDSGDKKINDNSSSYTNIGKVETDNPTATEGDMDEDLEEGEIDDEDEEEEPLKEDTSNGIATVDLTKSSKTSHEASESSDHSDANFNKRRTDEESEPSDGGKKNTSRDEDRRKERKNRRDKRSDRDLRKEIQDDEAKKREIKEKIRALEMQMKIDDDDEPEDEDLEEMGILCDGGSPREESRRRRKRKSESDPNNEIDTGQGERGERSRSRSPKRRKRERDDHRRRRGREQDDNKRGGFGSGGFGTGFNRNGAREEKSSQVCKQFMQGKCPKSPQNCMYSHDVVPPKIMELCKFYLLERCAKREKCLYLHKGFPCKYFHTGYRCMDDAESCKFSHGDLSDVTRTILLKVLIFSIVWFRLHEYKTAHSGTEMYMHHIFVNNCSTWRQPQKKFLGIFRV